MFKLKYFPTAWKAARVRVTKKANKQSYEDVKSFRPISVLNVLLGNICEKIMYDRLAWIAKCNLWLSDHQHGFVEQRSTEMAVHALISII